MDDDPTRDPSSEIDTESEAARASVSIRGEEADEHEINRRLRAQYAEIAQLAGGLAHEIRNPLSTLSLNLDLLAEDFQHPDTPRDQRVLKKIDRLRRETQRLQDILEDFLRFARVQELHKVPSDLNLLVEDLHQGRGHPDPVRQ
jgi:signal transduction histidine kinase